MLTFLISGHGGDGLHTASVDIVDDADRVIDEVAGVTFETDPIRHTDFGTSIVAVFGKPGRFAVRCVIDGIEQYRAHFWIRQGAQG